MGRAAPAHRIAPTRKTVFAEIDKGGDKFELPIEVVCTKRNIPAAMPKAAPQTRIVGFRTGFAVSVGLAVLALWGAARIAATEANKTYDINQSLRAGCAKFSTPQVMIDDILVSIGDRYAFARDARAQCSRPAPRP